MLTLKSWVNCYIIALYIAFYKKLQKELSSFCSYNSRFIESYLLNFYRILMLKSLFTKKLVMLLFLAIYTGLLLNNVP